MFELSRAHTATYISGHSQSSSGVPFFFHFLEFLRRQVGSVFKQPSSVAVSCQNPKSAIIGVKTGVKFYPKTVGAIRQVPSLTSIPSSHTIYPQAKEGGKMSKIYNVKLISSPFNSSLEVAGDLVISLHAPYSDDMVTVKTNPNVVGYQEKPMPNVRQVKISKETDETHTLTFDFQSNNVQKTKVNNKDYEIKLLRIGKVRQEEGDFPVFEFQVTEL